jgi:hypothetical protein
MATTITGNGPLKTARVPLGGTAGNTTAITLPRWARDVQVGVYESDNSTQTGGTLSSSGTDGAAADSAAIRIDSAVPMFFGLSPSENEVTIYVSGDEIDAVAHIRVTS